MQSSAAPDRQRAAAQLLYDALPVHFPVRRPLTAYVRFSGKYPARQVRDRASTRRILQGLTLRLGLSLVVLVEILEEMRRNRTMPKPSRDPPKQGVEIPAGQTPR